MIYFDITKTGAARHRSGLARMSERLRDELGAEACGLPWEEIRARIRPEDWFVTSEQFSERERPGFAEFVRARGGRTAAIFADAIPLKHPHITWPQSVARHPGYMKLLASFERVWAISAASRDELRDYWRWLGLESPPVVEVLPLGADLSRTPRTGVRPPSSGLPMLLCVGILEPRKNQLLLLDVCDQLWREGLRFELNLVGRVNPHFGAPIVARIKALQQRWPTLHHDESASDETLNGLYARARACVCPTIAEGCGLPLLESLWHGVPCVCSDLPVLLENAGAGGCLPVKTGDSAAWREALFSILTDNLLHTRLTSETMGRSLPQWAEAAAVLKAALK